MLESTLKNFKEKRDSAFLRQTSISVEYLKKDLNDSLSAAIAKLPDSGLATVNSVQMSYLFDENNNLFRNLDFFFDADCDDNVISTSYTALGNFNVISRVFEVFLNELRALDYVYVDDTYLNDENMRGIYITIALNN